MLPSWQYTTLADSVQMHTLRTHTFLWRIAGSDAGSDAPRRRLYGHFWQDSAREEREVGVREEEDNKSQLRLERGVGRG